MNPKETLYYALGELAYAIATADGYVDEHEKEKFHRVMVGKLARHKINFDISDIIFRVLEKDKCSPVDAYANAIRQMRVHHKHFTKRMRKEFITVAEQVASVYQSGNNSELKIVERFRRELEDISLVR